MAHTTPGNRILGLLAAASGVVLVLSACGVKRTVSVPVPRKILEARTATLDELLKILEDRSAAVRSLSCNSLKITLTTGKAEGGQIEEYRSAPGYVLVARPASIRLNVQNPISKTTILEVLSVGDDFSIWYPRENKFYTGENSTREFDLGSESGGRAFTFRPVHFLHAILPETLDLDQPTARVSMEEDQDSTAKYYVLSLFEETSPKELMPLRRVWIERSRLLPVREKRFNENGSVAGIVTYSDFVPNDGTELPLGILIDRPADGYTLDMQCRSWKLNPVFPENAFVMTPPAGAERVVLQPKPKGGDK